MGHCCCCTLLLADLCRFELQKNGNVAPILFPRPDGAVMPLQPATVSPNDTGINSECAVCWECLRMMNMVHV